MRKILLLLVCGLGPASLYGHSQTKNITQDELVRRTQQLADAVAVGDQGPWKNYYADDAMVFDEKGRSMDKKAQVADITPLPPGYSGTIKVENPWSRIEGDVAVFGYVMNETEIVYGRVLHARYHEVDTWLRRNGDWKIVAAQVMRYYQDPAPGKVDAREWQDYVGTYQLAPGKTIIVTQDAGQLFEQKADKPKVQLIPEAGPIFFRKGVEGRTLFQRGANGKVDKLIERRNDEDIIWKRLADTLPQ